MLVLVLGLTSFHLTGLLVQLPIPRAHEHHSWKTILEGKEQN